MSECVETDLDSKLRLPGAVRGNYSSIKITKNHWKASSLKVMGKNCIKSRVTNLRGMGRTA
eukprot:1894779-Amphidinium_carterae.1